jgi:hypothetical protein
MPSPLWLVMQHPSLAHFDAVGRGHPPHQNSIARLRVWPLEDGAMDGRNAQIAAIAGRVPNGSIRSIAEVLGGEGRPHAVMLSSRLDV